MNTISFPKLGSSEYTVAKAKGKLLIDLGEELTSQFKNDRTGELFWFSEDVYRHMREVSCVQKK